MENRLLLFVSSLIGELLHEREAVETVVRGILPTRPWVFEHTPASAEPRAESYLRKVRECDIFILLVGSDISNPVKEEYQTAVNHDKPCLVFLKDVERSAEAEAFINEINVKVKWAKFSTTDELQQQVQQAVVNQLIIGCRGLRLKAIEVAKLLALTLELRTILITTLVLQIILLLPVHLILGVNTGGACWSIGAIYYAMCCAGPIAFPAFVTSVLLAKRVESRKEMFLSLLIAALAIITLYLWFGGVYTIMD